MEIRRFRERFIFWLNLQDNLDFQIADTISQLKQGRLFTQTIRDGIRLIVDLRHRKLDVLYELFPWTQDALNSSPTPLNTRGLEQEIEHLKQVILSQGIRSTTPVTGPRHMDVPAFGDPTFDDDFDLNIKKDTSTGSAQNFLNSMRALQQ